MSFSPSPLPPHVPCFFCGAAFTFLGAVSPWADRVVCPDDGMSADRAFRFNRHSELSGSTPMMAAELYTPDKDGSGADGHPAHGKP